MKTNTRISSLLLLVFLGCCTFEFSGCSPAKDKKPKSKSSGQSDKTAHKSDANELFKSIDHERLNEHLEAASQFDDFKAIRGKYYELRHKSDTTILFEHGGYFYSGIGYTGVIIAFKNNQCSVYHAEMHKKEIQQKPVSESVCKRLGVLSDKLTEHEWAMPLAQEGATDVGCYFIRIDSGNKSFEFVYENPLDGIATAVEVCASKSKDNKNCRDLRLIQFWLNEYERVIDSSGM